MKPIEEFANTLAELIENDHIGGYLKYQTGNFKMHLYSTDAARGQRIPERMRRQAKASLTNRPFIRIPALMEEQRMKAIQLYGSPLGAAKKIREQLEIQEPDLCPHLVKRAEHLIKHLSTPIRAHLVTRERQYTYHLHAYRMVYLTPDEQYYKLQIPSIFIGEVSKTASHDHIKTLKQQYIIHILP